MRYLRPLPNWDSVITWPEDHVLSSSNNVWGAFATNRQEEREHFTSQQRPIWIDAICINQNDRAEKENQVKLMDKIYANATTVKIWLGEANDSYIADYPRLKSLQPIGLVSLTPKFHLGQYGRMPVVLAFIAQALRNVRAGGDYPTASKSAIDAAYRNRVHGFPTASADEWKILRSFFGNPWFERIWVVQEVVHARRAIVILGDWQVEWKAIGEAATWFQAYGFALPPDFKSTEDMKDLIPVDRVYAAYSLAEETSNTDKLDPLIEPTYDENLITEVYPNVSRFLIIEHGNLAALSHAGGIQGVKTSDYPSWVPDWSQPKISIELVNDNQDELPYNADGNEHLTIGDSTDSKCLSAKGIRVPAGVVRAYGDKLISYGFRHKTYKEEQDFVKSAWNLIAHLANGKGRPEDGKLKMYRPENILHTFISTLTTGLTNTKQPIDDDPNFLDDAADWLLQQFGGRIPVTGMNRKWRLPGAIWNSSNSGRFHEAFTRVCLHRRFFVTTGNLMGIGPETMEKDDMIVILFGGKVPYVVRELGEAKYSFIGECYVPGLMTGEAVEPLKKNGRKAEFFNLV
ncbi:hypothetical protein M434DRAFT_77799 [Hypoxylon sp. CO27-5]|nr:hypothetical protein M434DRAFT_77799 [Hypoxylon sp. CO27-5]